MWYNISLLACAHALLSFPLQDDRKQVFALASPASYSAADLKEMADSLLEQRVSFAEVKADEADRPLLIKLMALMPSEMITVELLETLTKQELKDLGGYVVLSVMAREVNPSLAKMLRVILPESDFLVDGLAAKRALPELLDEMLQKPIYDQDTLYLLKIHSQMKAEAMARELCDRDEPVLKATEDSFKHVYEECMAREEAKAYVEPKLTKLVKKSEDAAAPEKPIVKSHVSKQPQQHEQPRVNAPKSGANTVTWSFYLTLLALLIN